MNQGWKKSTYSATDGCCTKWRKSTYSCGAEGCVKFSEGEDVVLLGDTKLETDTDPDGPYQIYSVAAWRNFIAGIKRGEFG